MSDAPSRLRTRLRSVGVVYIIAVAALAVLASGAILHVTRVRDRSRAQLDAQFTDTPQLAVSAVVSDYDRFCRFVVENDLASRGTGAIVRNLEAPPGRNVRARLRSELRPLYPRLRERGILQLELRSQDGAPLVGVPEGGAITSGEARDAYRLVYPLFPDEPSGVSVEFVVSLRATARKALDLIDAPGDLLIEIDGTYRAIAVGGQRQWVEPVREAALEAAARSDPARDGFAVPTTAAGIGYVAGCVSMHGPSGRDIGKLIVYEQTDAYELHRDAARGRAVVLGVVLSVMVGLVLLAHRAHRLADEADRAKSQFLANVSHELRTPMSGVVGMITALQEPRLADEKRSEYLRLLRSASDDLVHMVDSILEMSRLDAGRVALRDEPLSLRSVVDDVVESMRSSDVAGGVGLRCELDSTLPDCVLGDRLRLRQVVRNCVHNALKFTREGGVTVSATTGRRTGEQVDVRITILDTGIGIPDEQLPRIFEKFSRGSATSAQVYGGSGLGLSIVKTLVDMMGGAVGIESMEGIGTRVDIDLSFRIAPAEACREAAPDPEEEPGSLRVLLVDDDEMACRVGVALLEQRGLEITAARSGEEALELATHQRFDAVLMDRHMPHMDGLEATARLHAYWEAHALEPVPIIGLSGSVSRSEQEECFSAGMVGFVSKPIQLGELLAALGSATKMTPPLDVERARSALADTHELVSDILPIFLRQSEERLAEIERGLNTRNPHAIHAQTHPLKTAALYLGADRLSQIASAIDETCRSPEEPDWNRLAEQVGVLREEIGRIRSWRREAAGTE